jgi:hypothetical protein
MVRSTALYSAGLSVWTAAAVAAWQILRLIAHWGYKDGRAYASYLFNDVTAIVYIFVAVASLAIGVLAFLAMRRVGRPTIRAALLATVVPAALLLSAALTVTLGILLQARENGALVHPTALLSIFPDALAIAAVGLGPPSVLAAALWSWFFCVR